MTKPDNPLADPANPPWSDDGLPARFAEGVLAGAGRSLPAAAVQALARRAGIDPAALSAPAARIRRDQFVALYKHVALATGDEMLGLWSRPIRARALKYLGSSLLGAPNLAVALFRFTRFWNLMLDDYVLSLTRQDGCIRLALEPTALAAAPNVLGHELMMKLAHGVSSWLLGRELAIHRMDFAFPRPARGADQGRLYPGPVRFDAALTALFLDEADGRRSFHRTREELAAFLRRAPEDWMFTASRVQPVALAVRRCLADRAAWGATLSDLAPLLHLSPRTLARRLAAEGVGFQAIKDELRRDVAVRLLTTSDLSLAAVAEQVGFADGVSFHRAFKRWTGRPPGEYRRMDPAGAESAALAD